MTFDEAVDAALAAFLQEPVDRPQRQGIEAAIVAFETTIGRCHACRGAKLIRSRGGRVYVNLGHKAAEKPAADGETIDCIACDATGTDLDEVHWSCVVGGLGRCHPYHPDSEHVGCGWVRRLPATEAGVAG